MADHVPGLALKAAPEPGLPIAVRRVLASQGRALDAQTRAFMECRLGHDFRSVRIHDDEEARDSARQLGALAYTVGGHVVLSEHAHLNRRSSRQTLAHELTHVVQQRAAPDANGVAAVELPGEGYESEVDRLADAVADGRRVLPPVARASIGLQRQATRTASTARSGEDRVREAIEDATPAELLAIVRSLERTRTELAVSGEGGSALRTFRVTIPGPDVVTVIGGLPAVRTLLAFAGGHMVSGRQPTVSPPSAPPAEPRERTEAEFIAFFEQTAVNSTRQLLRHGRERAESERRRYGLHTVEGGWIFIPHGAPVRAPGIVRMADNTDTRHLREAAQQLREEWLEIRRTRADLAEVRARASLRALERSLGSGLLIDTSGHESSSGPSSPGSSAVPPWLQRPQSTEGGASGASPAVRTQGTQFLDPRDPAVLTSLVMSEERQWQQSVRLAETRFPILGPLLRRENPAEALAPIAGGATEAAPLLMQTLDENVAAIAETERTLTAQRIWSLPMVVERTTDELGLRPHGQEYEWVEARLRARREHDEWVGVAMTALSYSLWILSLAAAGTGVGIAAVGFAAGISAGSAAHDVHDYLRREAESRASLVSEEAVSLDEPSGFDLALSVTGAVSDVLGLPSALRAQRALMAPARARLPRSLPAAARPRPSSQGLSPHAGRPVPGPLLEGPPSAGGAPLPAPPAAVPVTTAPASSGSRPPRRQSAVVRHAGEFGRAAALVFAELGLSAHFGGGTRRAGAVSASAGTARPAVPRRPRTNLLSRTSPTEVRAGSTPVAGGRGITIATTSADAPHGGPTIYFGGSQPSTAGTVRGSPTPAQGAGQHVLSLPVSAANETGQGAASGRLHVPLVSHPQFGRAAPTPRRPEPVRQALPVAAGMGAGPRTTGTRPPARLVLVASAGQLRPVASQSGQRSGGGPTTPATEAQATGEAERTSVEVQGTVPGSPTSGRMPTAADVQREFESNLRAPERPLDARPDNEYQELVRRLRQLRTETSARILADIDCVWRTLHDIGTWADVVADIWHEAQSVGTTIEPNISAYTQAVINLSQRAGAGVVIIMFEPDWSAPVGETIMPIGSADAPVRLIVGPPRNDQDIFIESFATQRFRFLDRAIGEQVKGPGPHGASTHLIQDLVIDKGCPGFRGHDFRGLLHDLPVELRRDLWNLMFDPPYPSRLINNPNLIFSIIQRTLSDLEQRGLRRSGVLE